MEPFFTTRTGVHVGRLYVNKTSQRPIEDPDMQKLQLALTLKPEQIRERKRSFIWYWISAAVLIGLIVLTVSFKSTLTYAKESKYKQKEHVLQFSNQLGEQYGH